MVVSAVADVVRRGLGAGLVVVALLVAAPAPASAAAADLPAPQHEPEEANEAVDEILRRPELRQPAESISERVQRWVFERLGRLVDAMFESGGATLLGWLVAALGLAAIVFFAVRLSRGVLRDPGVVRSAPVVPRRSPTDWRADAETHEAAGQWRAALRCRYRALVADLAARGLVEEVPGRTAGEYRHEVTRSVPAAAPDFSDATGLFELAWYGDHPTGPGENERFRELANRVLSGAGR